MEKIIKKINNVFALKLSACKSPIPVPVCGVVTTE